MAEGMKAVYENYHVYDALLRNSSVANHIPKIVDGYKTESLEHWTYYATICQETFPRYL